VLVSTLSLAMGLVLLATARLSGNPSAYGLVVFVGFVFVAVACAMHLGTVVDRLFGSTAWRISAKGVVWLLIGGGTAWLIGRAPREEVLFALALAPVAVGAAGVAVARDDRWRALAFVAVAGLHTTLVVAIWAARQLR
jgi:hypothetical protein